jgi:hypothetical protein
MRTAPVARPSETFRLQSKPDVDAEEPAMNRFWDRVHSDDRGSILLALLAILILTGVASAGLAAVVNGQTSARHDAAFTQAINNAESGLNAMVTQIKAHSTQAAFSLPPTPAYTVTANAVTLKDGTNAVTKRTWTLTSVGTATVGGHTETRTVTELVTINSIYKTPVYGKNGLILTGKPSGVTNYNPGDQDLDGDGLIDTPTYMSPTGVGGLPGQNVALPTGGLPGGAAAGPSTGPENDGLQLTQAEIGNFSQIGDDADNCDAYGNNCSNAKCQPASVCSGSIVVKGAAPPPDDAQNCPTTDSGASIVIGGTKNADGTVTGGTNINADILPLQGLGVIFNTQITNPLNAVTHPGDSLLSQICTDLPIVIPSLGVDLSASGLASIVGNLGDNQLTGALNNLLSGLLGGVLGSTDLGTLSAPMNLSTANCNAAAFDGGTVPSGTLCAADPRSLDINALPNPLTGVYPPVILGTNTLSTVPTIISGTISDPGGTCQISGNVILFGTINCNKIVTNGPNSSLTVYYDEDLTENDINTELTITNYRELNT